MDLLCPLSDLGESILLTLPGPGCVDGRLRSDYSRLCAISRRLISQALLSVAVEVIAITTQIVSSSLP